MFLYIDGLKWNAEVKNLIQKYVYMTSYTQNYYCMFGSYVIHHVCM